MTRGTLWITQEDDTQDVVLRTGDNWAVERNGLTVVEAQEDAIFCVTGRHLDPVVVSRSSRARSPWTKVRDAVAAFLATQPRGAVPYF